MNVFNEELLKRATRNASLLDKFKLLFRPTNYSCDDNLTIEFKEIEGVVFIKKLHWRE